MPFRMPQVACSSRNCGRLRGTWTWRGGWFERFRKPTVHDFHRAVALDIDVGGFEIAVDDPLLVRGFERLGNLRGNQQRLVARNQRQPRTTSHAASASSATPPRPYTKRPSAAGKPGIESEHQPKPPMMNIIPKPIGMTVDRVMSQP